MNLERSSASPTLGAQTEKSLSAVQETWVWSLDREDSPGEENGNPLQYSFFFVFCFFFTPVFSRREFHGQRSVAGYCPWGCKESDTTEQISLHFISVSSNSNFSYFMNNKTETLKKEVVY